MQSQLNQIDLPEFARLAATLTNAQLAIRYNVSKRTVRRWKAAMRDQDQMQSVDSALKFPTGSSETFDGYPRLIADKAIVLGDAEIPDHDPEMFDLALRIGEKRGIETLILNGDFVALDSFSSFPADAPKQIPFKEELNMAIESVHVFARQFKRILWISGNHERRLSHRINGQISLSYFLNNIGGLDYTEYSYCELSSAGTDILVCHPINYRRVKLSLATEIAAIKLKCIIAGHTHHLAMGWDRSGKYWVVDGGFCRDQSKTRYKSMRITTHPEWNPGFVLVESGYPFLVTKDSAKLWLQH